jgi:hypothetical protein
LEEKYELDSITLRNFNKPLQELLERVKDEIVIKYQPYGKSPR